MDVFLSWSGTHSKAVASALRAWLPDVMQWVKPWMSADDINAGARWSNEIEGRLRDSKFGIICLTASNQTAPWILFEAGAIAKSVADQSFVCPLLIRFAPPALSPGPMTQFQAKTLDRAGVLGIVRSINSASVENGLPSDKLDRAFATWWPTLEATISAIPDEVAAAPKRSSENMIEEILESTRTISALLQRDASQATVVPRFADTDPTGLHALARALLDARSIGNAATVNGFVDGVIKRSDSAPHAPAKYDK